MGTATEKDEVLVDGDPAQVPAGEAAGADTDERADDVPPPAGPVANLAACLTTAAVGVAGAVAAVALGLGTPAQPGAGLWPLAVSVAVVVLSLAQVLIGRRGGDGEKFSRYSWLSLVGLATLLGLVALLPVIGFEIPSLLLSVVWMKFLGGETWRSALLYSALVVGVLYAVFVGALGTNVPHLF
ncbi:Tripartite tricarboxylate transporter TctB family protein [Promicromonospora umidemergens]|uniref:Tripartite tricarboxylate transporter TctB family protein n=1 Tax=Promicromonospora umidemergens TaxID=629679 RepID=A0ABP8XXN2_9MICO|nr:tripartite tricarboxylate transporter TctB family protein [Promicromonospora umidemergens]MCP2286172.1 Tripartite tricarboxylate transporter TctB family protein [Promicromonospora umidemergens]